MLGREEGADIDDGVARALDRALAAAQAEALVDFGEIVLHRDGTGRAGLGTEAAGDAADLAHLAGELPGVMV